MAIDTAEKRRNIAGLYTGFHPVAVNPNASKDVEWRQQAGWGYSGILPGGTIVETKKPQVSLRPRLGMGLTGR